MRTLTMRSLTDGVIVGLLLAQLFFCNLIALCGDVELNPGPNPKTSEMRQTRLTSKSGEGSGDRRFSAGGADVAADPTLLDVMTKLTEMDSNIDKKLIGLKGWPHGATNTMSIIDMLLYMSMID